MRRREIKPALVFDHSQREAAAGDQGSEPLTDHPPLFAAVRTYGRAARYPHACWEHMDLLLLLVLVKQVLMIFFD